MRTHFAVEGSKAFVRSLKGRIVETSGTRIYRAKGRNGSGSPCWRLFTEIGGMVMLAAVQAQLTYW